MTSPPRPITVRCPRCSTTFETSYRASINLTLDEEWSEDEIDKATTATCRGARPNFPVGNGDTSGTHVATEKTKVPD